MNTMAWLGVAILGFIVYLLILYLRDIRDHFVSPKTIPVTPPTTPVTGTAPVTPTEPAKGFKVWRAKQKWWLTTIAVVVGGLMLWWLWGAISTTQSPSFDTVWTFGKNHWLKVLVASGVVLLVALVVDGKWATALRWSTASVLVLLWVIAPIGALIVERSGSMEQNCLPFSNISVHRCVLTETPVVLRTERLTYSEVLDFCIVKPENGSYNVKKIGPNTFELRSTKGALPIEYKLLKGRCPDKFD